MPESPLGRVASRLREGSFAFGPSEELEVHYDSFVEAVRSLPGRTVRARVKAPEHLREAARVGLILYDSVVLTGGGGNELEVIVLRRDEGEIQVHGQDLPPAGTEVAPAFVQFPRDAILPWLDEAEALIEQERLIYVPQRALMWHHGESPQGGRNWRVESLDDTTPWGLWRVISEAGQTNSMPLFLGERADVMGLEVASAALPFLARIPLDLFHKVLQDEADTFSQFRVTLHAGLTEYTDEASAEDQSELVRRGEAFRRDVVEPEVDRLKRKMKRIVEKRAIRIAGAGLGVAALTLTAAPSAGLTSLLGAGGVGLIANEYAAYRDEMAALKDEPWHFAWRLREKARP